MNSSTMGTPKIHHTKWIPHTNLTLQHFQVHNPFKTSPSQDSQTSQNSNGTVRTRASQNISSTPSFEQHHHHLPEFHWPTFCLPEAASHQDVSYRAHADVLCFPRHYIIEIEAPGLPNSATERVHVEWMSPRTVGISADVPESVSSAKAEGSVAAKKADTKTNGATQQDDLCESSVRERYRGHWRRTFTLPEDSDLGIDPESGVNGQGLLDWKIEDGLIKVFVPRRNMQKRTTTE